MNPSSSDAGCPPGSIQTGNGCLPAQGDPPPSSYPVQTVTLPVPAVVPDVPLDQPTPGTAVYVTSEPAVVSRVPRWAWWLGIGGALVGATALITRARR